MSRMAPDEERDHGMHTDSFYPGLIRSVWKKGPFRLTRERKYADRTNSKLKGEAWILSLLGANQRLGVKYERDVGFESQGVHRKATTRP